MQREGRTTVWAGVGSLLLLSSMSAVKWNAMATETLRRRASFDLPRAGAKLRIVELGHDKSKRVTTLGVEGCQGKAMYVYIPEVSGWALDVGRMKPAATLPQ